VRGIVSIQDGLVFETVCTDLESEGYEVQTFNIPAVGVGAPHKRERIWIVANSRCSVRGSNLPGIQKALDQGHLKRPSGQQIQVRLQDQVKEPRLWPTPTGEQKNQNN
jgi:site-specific DNA-cytosine methylase